MTTNLQLKNLLETMTDLTLARSMSFLQAYFEQGNAPDLCRKPPSMSQLSEESTYQFIIRCLEMKQKVYIVSKQSDEITYEPCATIIFENP